MKKLIKYSIIFTLIMIFCGFLHGTTEPSFAVSTPTDTVPSRNYTIVIDPGHGGIDPGSIGYKTKVKESELNLKLSKMLAQKLEDSGINIVMTAERARPSKSRIWNSEKK